MLQLTTWPCSVTVLGQVFPVMWRDLGEGDGEMRCELWAGGDVSILVHQKHKDTDYAWRVLFHEMCHAAWLLSGVSELFGTEANEESVAVASEAVWQALVGAGDKRAVASSVRGSKGRATRTRRTNPRTKRPSR